MRSSSVVKSPLWIGAATDRELNLFCFCLTILTRLYPRWGRELLLFIGSAATVGLLSLLPHSAAVNYIPREPYLQVAELLPVRLCTAAAANCWWPPTVDTPARKTQAVCPLSSCMLVNELVLEVPENTSANSMACQRFIRGFETRGQIHSPSWGLSLCTSLSCWRMETWMCVHLSWACIVKLWLLRKPTVVLHLQYPASGLWWLWQAWRCSETKWFCQVTHPVWKSILGLCPTALFHLA